MHPKFQIYTDISSLPISEHEAYQEEGFCGICTGGTAVIEVFSVRSPISENDIVTILPLQLVSIREVSDDFSMTFFKVDKEMFLDIMSGLGKITPDFFFYMRKNFLYSVNDVDRNRFLGFAGRSISGAATTIPFSCGRPFCTCCGFITGISMSFSSRRRAPRSALS